MPQIGPLARVRWRPLTHHRAHQDDHRRLVDAAFSYEGSADEASFVLGPALVGALAALIDPAAALVTAAVLLAVFGTSFALHETAAFVAGQRRDPAHTPARLMTIGFVLLALAQLGIGVVFGSIQTGTTVLARAEGQLGMAGLLQALLGVGSVAAGIALAMLPTRFGYPSRLAAFATAFVVLALPLLVVDSLGWLAVELLVLGVAIAPYMITVFTLAERLVPAERSGAAMTLLSGVTGLGYAIGSTVAGRLADEHGHQAAYAVAVSAGFAMLVLAWTARPLLTRRQASAEATPHERSTVNA
jgi:predicted MFS family arabinose efflux permease